MAKEITFTDDLPKITQNEVTNETFVRAIRKLQPMSRNKIKDKTLQKQRSVICILKDEQREILNNLKVIKSPYNDKINNKTVQEISKLVKAEERIEKYIETEKEYIKDLNSQIEKTQYLLLWERKKGGKVHHGKSGTRENVVKGLENRLHVSRVKLSETLKENKEYRKEIYLYLKTRSNFNTLYNRLIYKLSLGKNTIHDILEQSRRVYNEREKLIKKLSKLKEKGKLSFNTQCDEMFELMLIKPKEISHVAFITTKNNDRSSMLHERKQSYAIEAERIETAEKVHFYQNIVEKIYNYTEECGATAGAAEYYKKEEANLYQLLLYANELNDELAVLQNDLDDKMKEYLEKKDELNDEQCKKTSKIGQMNAYLTEIQLFKQKQEKQLEDHTVLLDKLLKGIQDLFAIGNCDNGPVMMLLGDKEDVTIYNAKLYLEIIEQKIVEIMNIDLYLFEMPNSSPTFPQHSEHLRTGSTVKNQSATLPTKIRISMPCTLCEEPKSHVRLPEKSKTVHI